MNPGSNSLLSLATGRYRERAIAFLLSACVAGCNAQSQQAKPKPRDALSGAPGAVGAAAGASRDVSHIDEFREFNLTIYGYNYTDTELGSFEVGGHGGGNLAVSTPTSAGGSSVCCFPLFTPLPNHNKIAIRWTRDGDTWCEQDVSFSGPVPSNAEYLEVHFYRDGHIELAVTPAYSPPRLRLDRLHGNSRNGDPSKNLNNDTNYSRCKLGYR